MCVIENVESLIQEVKLTMIPKKVINLLEFEVYSSDLETYA